MLIHWVVELHEITSPSAILFPFDCMMVSWDRVILYLSMKLLFRELSDAPRDLGETEVRICSSQFEEITGQPAARYRLKPWKGRVVSVSTESGTVWRLLKGHGTLSIPAGECWMGPKTRTQVDVHKGSEITIECAYPQWLGRMSYYNNHLDDTVRFTFRIGIFGLVFAIVSLAIGIFY
jgi:hypothetical protein